MWNALTRQARLGHARAFWTIDEVLSLTGEGELVVDEWLEDYEEQVSEAGGTIDE